ncbi:MAG: 3-hydroxyacyl-CoA dehydrogenase family protein [Clostridiales bacterium]|nr:3-hydroxyacyl-CoA dehydrogenase family protein [Clostridiales bacterium]
MEIMKIGVLGAGQMGAGIAQIAASKGYVVVLRDIKQEFCDNAIAKMKAGFDKRVAQGKETRASVNETMRNLSTTVDLEDMRDCDLVIEAVPEIFELKKSTFKELGRTCRSDAILCTNTSSMSVTEITSECAHPERCAGMHFFFPVAAMRLVEIIRGKETSDATVDAIKAVSVGMGKTPVLCRADTPGFIVNRCLFAFMLEAIHCYEDGIASIEDIDTAVKLGLNHPLGPFEMMDMSGLDTFPHVCDTLQSLPVTDWSTPESVKKLLANGRLGRKNGHGWHDYE